MAPREVQVKYIRKNSLLKEWVRIGTGSPGGAGVTIPGSVPEMTGHGTQCCGLTHKVVMAQRLDWAVLKVFPNRNDSMILHYIT